MMNNLTYPVGFYSYLIVLFYILFLNNSLLFYLINAYIAFPLQGMLLSTLQILVHLLIIITS